MAKSQVNSLLMLLFVLVVISTKPTYLSKLNTAHWVQHYAMASSYTWLIFLIILNWASLHHRRLWYRLSSHLSLILAGLFLHAGILRVHLAMNSQTLLAQRFGVAESFATAISILLFAWLYLWGRNKYRSKRLFMRCMNATALIFISPALLQIINFWVPGLTMTSLDQFVPNYTLAHCLSMFVCLVVAFKSRMAFDLQLPIIATLFVMMIQLLGMHFIGHGSIWAALINGYASFDRTTIALATLPLCFLPSYLGYRHRLRRV